MAAPYGQLPFSHAEKNTLLAEIIKHHAPSTDYLLQVVSNLLQSQGRPGPNWEDITLHGRSLNECRHAFDEIRRTSLTQQTPAIHPMPSQSMSPMSAPLASKRTFPVAFEQPRGSYSAGRELLPKPYSGSGSIEQPSPLDQPPRKKRGRPTKAEAQAKIEAQGSGEPGPAPMRPPVLDPQVARQPQPQPARPLEPLTIETPRQEEIRQAPIPRMSVSSMLTPTGQKSNSQSSSSSGKRRRGRSTRSEPEDLPRLEESTQSSSRQAQEYESPYARMGTDVQDSPARAAVLRHRDEPDPTPTFPGAQRTGVQEQPSTTGPPTTGPS